jgi:hypothetical protein
MKLLVLLLAMPIYTYAAAPKNNNNIETVVVKGRKVNLIGQAVSAAEGVVGQQEMQLRPLLRTGEVLELVPGMVVTQHSGTGKANQYFLRGFNLDHGTDFATFVDNMPVNMRTHGHGQGYTDLNFLIPELVGKLTYKKGPYYADIGDFSGAGSAEMLTLDRLDHGSIDLTAGQNNYGRLLIMDNIQWEQANSLLALEHNRYDGPWSNITEDLSKTNILLKHNLPLADGLFSVGFMGYKNQWNSADQIPRRAVTSGVIDELGSIDDTVGGESSRYSLNADWKSENLEASVYAINYKLNVWSNFTYFLDDEENGDQFEQVDDRMIYGGQFKYNNKSHLAGYSMNNRFGVGFRVDDIDDVGLYHTKARHRLGVIRDDAVRESSLGAFWENRIVWTNKVRSVLGARFDVFDFDVDSKVGVNANGVNLTDNSGSTKDDLSSLKGSLIYALDSGWETYMSAGQGLHSNDARGTTATVNPADGETIKPVDPLVRSFGYEAGARGFIADSINTSISFWQLALDSELLFVGDAGSTEASRASRRQGMEVTAYYYFTPELSLDFEYALTDSKFTDDAPEGNEIPSAVDQVFQAGLNVDLTNGWFGSLRLRYFGERPLIEDGSIKSDSSTIFNIRTGYSKNDWTFNADILNLTDSNDHDIDYFYESRLPTEPSGLGTEDIHYHVIEPRTIRLSINYKL